MKWNSLPGFIPVYEDEDFALLGRPSCAEATRGVVIAHSAGESDSDFILPDRIKTLRHLAPDGYRLYSSAQLFGLLGQVKGFEEVNGGQSVNDLELFPVALDDTDACFNPDPDADYHLVIIKQPMRLNALLSHSKVQAYYSSIDLHVCRCDADSGPMYFLDVPEIPATDLKQIHWQVFG